MLISSHKLIDQINETLFGAEQRRIQNWIDKLAKQNSEMFDKHPPLGFMHEGVYYAPTFLGRGIWPKLMLHDKFEDEARTLVADKTTVENDKQYVTQTLFALISSSETAQDLRDTFPECLVPLAETYPMLTSFNRTREPACTIQDNPRALRQFEKILPTIETYSAARLIY